MILNMHITDQYRAWGCAETRKRERTLCGKLTAPKYTGVPGISPNLPSVSNGVDYGWCLECCAVFLKETFPILHSLSNDLLIALYNNGRAVAGEQLELATSQN